MPPPKQNKESVLQGKNTVKRASTKREMVQISPACNLLNNTNTDCKNELGVKED